MNDHRSDRIQLPASEARCEPSGYCVARGTCARYKAALVRGAPLGDFSREACGGTVLCPGYFAISRLAEPKAIKPRVHPPMGSN